MEYTLVNFNIPNHLKHNFDELVKYKRTSRTSVINGLIEMYCRQEYKRLEDDDKINRLILDMKVRNSNSKPVMKVQSFTVNETENYEPPMVPSFDDEWDDNLKL